MTAAVSTSVAYIFGSGRNGSTILGNLLATTLGGIFIGESYYLWDRGLRDNRKCGCGQPFRSCSFWREVLERAGFVGNPIEEVRRLAGAFSLVARPGQPLQLASHHTISGNPVRFQTGPVQLVNDNEWVTAMATGPKPMVTTLALPWLKHFGYPVLRR